ncbi:MAG: MBL fold metallo-hydrolase [Oscillospiraceae bacterium]|jgi:glyoxylase-like metal-dependent hydrolase (beta-lactamase superfamily II)|nr:MBL fold metallo-hydrolase [Oscillospiraceae bacterium]
MAYFKAHSFGGGVYMLYEPLGVGSHLIIGNKKALLIDTGFGFGDIAAAVREITEKPVIVANSHIHPDHSMGNNQFERVFVGAGDMYKLEGGILEDEYKKMLGFSTKYLPPLGLLIKHYKKIQKSALYKTEYSALTTGDKIELGGRTVEILEMPGHTKGSVVFLDRTAKTVFAGDAVNRGMFLYLDSSVKLARYADRLDKLAGLAGFDILRTSHSKQGAPFAFVGYYADFLRRVDLSKCKSSPMPLSDGKVLRYSEKSRDYGTVSVFFNRGQEGK